MNLIRLYLLLSIGDDVKTDDSTMPTSRRTLNLPSKSIKRTRWLACCETHSTTAVISSCDLPLPGSPSSSSSRPGWMLGRTGSFTRSASLDRKRPSISAAVSVSIVSSGSNIASDDVDSIASLLFTYSVKIPLFEHYGARIILIRPKQDWWASKLLQTLN